MCTYVSGRKVQYWHSPVLRDERLSVTHITGLSRRRQLTVTVKDLVYPTPLTIHTMAPFQF